jgi:hypothetical protein
MEVSSMFGRFTLVAVTFFLGVGAAWAQTQAPDSQSRQESEYTDTLYATDQHMGFSIRNTMLRLLGGVSLAREPESKAAERDGWWGEPVPQVPPELVRAEQSNR